MNPSGQLVDLLAPQELGWKHISGDGRWLIAMPAEPGIVFGMVLEGEASAVCGETIPLRQGDYLLLIGPDEWMLGTDHTRTAIPFEALEQEPAGLRVNGTGSSPSVRMMAGHFAAKPDGSHLLRRFLPRLIHVGSHEAAGRRLRSLLTLIDEESAMNDAASEPVVRRLLEVMMVEAFRTRLRLSSDVDAGLLAGLADTRLRKAIIALHAQLGRSWTVEELADVAGMSRSALADSFTRRVGMPPMVYLSTWRFAIAKQALRSSSRPISEIAQRAGYSSTSAFSNAFRNFVGAGPAEFRNARR